MTNAETIRVEFESFIRTSEKFKDNTPLGTMQINGEFHHYMDADTDTMWLGFAFGYRTHERLVEGRQQLLTALQNKNFS